MSEAAQVIFRVDPRLVHATLMNAWVPATKAGWILIADAQVNADPRRRTIYEMSAADAVRVEFVAEPGAAERVAALRAEGPGIVLFTSLASVLRAMRADLQIDALNVGHVPAGPGRKELHPAVHLGAGDLEMLRQIDALGVQAYVQPLPDDDRLAPDPDRLHTVDVAPAMAPDDSGPMPVPAAVAAAAEQMAAQADYAKAELEVVNERGLHLRAAHALAALCNELPVHIEVGRPGEMVNAKSLLGLTTLGAARGSRLEVVVRGEGAPEALGKIRELFEAGFYELAGANK